MKTKVISLIGEPGSGKSAEAASIYHQLKSQGINCELVREYVKEWAWENRTITQFDYPGIFGNQFKSESILYNKVDYVITDCPLILIPIFEEYYFGKSLMLSSCLQYLDYCRQNSIEHVYFLLNRKHEYNTIGRYETEEESLKFREFLIDKLKELNIKYHDLKDLRDVEL